MKLTFDYNKFNEEVADSLVETGCELAYKAIEGKAGSADYAECSKKFNEEFMRFCVEGIPGAKFENLEQIKNPMIHNNMFFTQRFDTILSQILTPVIPTVASAGYEDLYEVFQVGFGDNAKYHVESNELFIVNTLAEGIARGGQQTASDTEYTVTAQRKQVSLYVDWYLVAANKLDFGKLTAKIGASFAAYIQAKLAKTMASLITNNTSGNNRDGIAGYIANGLSVNNWLTVARNLSLANGGADIYALGTKLALKDVLPASSDTQFRYTEDSAIIKKGYLPSYKEVPLIELGNALVPNTLNGPSAPSVVLPDNVIYMLPLGHTKPIKVVFEGNSVSVSKDPLQSVDHSYGFTVDIRMGADIVIGSKIGAITLA